ncbi:MAG TPA: pyridoxamine 5'-phosphate oxidase family protein [Candidatus Binatia bacterium]|nr:pyridoxamine 5'-phosphate oxidase family protein [Candidatus Binatia bacterium]
MSLAMSKAQRESFLAETRPGIISIAEPGRGPLSVPIWYSYQPGGVVRMLTGGASKKAALLRAAGRASLCVQTETAPYQYVSVEGPISIGVPDFERDARPMALRYLGEQMGELYLAMTKDERQNSILVTLTPERWLTVDYTKMAVS